MPEETVDVPDEQFPELLRTSESQAIEARRVHSGLPASGKPIGLALSGGGIRSATFSLGVLQSLASLNLLRKIDYLSTVSGGGYVGGFLGRLYTRPGKNATTVSATLANANSFEMRWLRENGRYLAPNGSGDVLTGIAVMLRNWAAVQCVLLLFLLIPLLSMSLLRYSVPVTVYETTRDAFVGSYWTLTSPTLSKATACRRLVTTHTPPASRCT